ncbi:MAG: nucleoside-diphosphate kinase [Candidatus Woesearchaeota archaeon]
MIEKSLILLKPDALQRGLVGEILSRFERVGLKIVALKMFYADKELAGKHYADDKDWIIGVGNKAIKSAEMQGKKINETALEIGLRVRNQLIEYITMSPTIAVVLEGHEAVKIVRKLVGDTNPHTSPPGTIRGDYTIDSYELADKSSRSIQNLIHASSSKAEAEREIKVWFKDEDLHVWERVDDDLIYRGLNGRKNIKDKSY